MRNIRLIIEYDGTDYAGWQVQKHRSSKTIQGTIEKALQKIFRKKIKLIASGRTDAGVHAVAQVANFRIGSEIALDKLGRALNGILPDDIAVIRTTEASADFHSRFDARTKVYRYLILNSHHRSALLKGRVYFCSYPLNIELMRQEAVCLLGKHDFEAFCASGSSARDTVRTIKRITLNKQFYPLFFVRYPPKDSQAVVVDIEADGFLYNMARNIVGTLIEIGRGRFSKGSLKKILASRNRNLAGPTLPAHGLYLLQVKY